MNLSLKSPFPVSHPAHTSSSLLARVLALLAIGTLVLVALTLVTARLLPAGGEVIFHSARNGPRNIYRADVHTGVQVNLSRDMGDDLAPAWSPDGTQIAFASFRDGGDAEIYVMDADGSHLRRLTDNWHSDSNPVWSPDGTRIAFESYRDSAQNIFMIDLATGEEQPVVTNPGGLYSVKPQWSPDGRQILFYSGDQRDPELFLSTLYEPPANRLTDNTVNDWNPVWSPDGEWLAYYSNADANMDVYALHLADGGIVRLTYHLSTDWYPSWSPDGRWIAFLSERGGRSELYLVGADCLATPDTCPDNARRVGGSPNYDDKPQWSPNSRYLTFVSSVDTSPDIYVIDAGCAIDGGSCDGNTPIRITYTAGTDRDPTWRPGG